jgi:hypothetical protein
MINFYAEHFWSKAQRVKGSIWFVFFAPLILLPFVLKKV